MKENETKKDEGKRKGMESLRLKVSTPMLGAIIKTV